MSELTTRLRRLGKDSVGIYRMPICDEAADRIEELEQECHRLRERGKQLEAELATSRELKQIWQNRAYQAERMLK